MHARPSIAAAALFAVCLAHAAPGDQPVKPLPPGAAASSALQPRMASLPAKGLFKGDQLTEAARGQLTDLVINAIGLQVDVALLVPTGPWKIEDSGVDERALTPARLAAVKRFLKERGVDEKHIFVESRIDTRIKEPRLDVQLVGSPAND